MKPIYYRTYIFEFLTSSGVKYYAGKRKSRFKYPTDDPYNGSGRIITRAVAKYGVDSILRKKWFTHDMTSIEYPDEMLGLIEAELIDSCIFMYKDACCNLASGGSGGYTLKYASDEAKAKRALQTKLCHSGKVVSADTRKKISNSRKGMILSDKHKNNISNRARDNQRVSGVWVDPLYTKLWMEWNDPNTWILGERLKYRRFFTHCKKNKICYESSAALITHFEKVIDGKEPLMYQSK